MPPRSLLAGGLALAALLALGIALTPGPVITLTTGSGERILCRPIDVGEPFVLVFRHSMYGGEVREEFEVQDGRLLRTGVTTENAAAAEYYAYDGRVEADAGGYRVMVPSVAFDELAIVLDRIGQHRLRIEDDEVALTQPGADPIRATLDVASMPLVVRVLTSGC